MSRKVLGKGLEALIPQSATLPTQAAAMNGATSEVALDRIDTNPRQPRKHFNSERLQELSQSISEDGVLQPVVVRRRGDRFELIMGERRIHAAKLAGMTEVPVVVKEHVRDVDSLRLALVENIQRENLNPIEVGLAYKQLVTEFSLSQSDLARMVGRDRSSVANSIRLLNLPEEVQQLVAEEKLSGGHAKALLSLLTQKEQLALGRRIVETGMSVRDAEKAVGLVKPKAKTTREPKERPAYLVDLEKTIGSHLGTRVSINEKRGGSGKITIEFYSHEDFERLTSLMEIPLPR